MKYLNKLNSLAVKLVSKKVVINHHVLFCNYRIINLHEFWYNDRYTCCGTYFAKVSCIYGVSVIFWVCMSLFVPKRKLRILRLEFVVGLLLSDLVFLLADTVNMMDKTVWGSVKCLGAESRPTNKGDDTT